MSVSDILIVDDDVDIRDALSRALELEGYRVSVAANGRVAWEKLHAEPPPALVLLDLMMPVMNGAELLTLLRADAQLRALPVVLVTAFGTSAAEFAPSSEGMLSKPIDLDQLMQLVSRYCRSRTA